MLLRGSVVKQYNIVPIDNYSKNLDKFYSRKDTEKVEKGIIEKLSINPYRYGMLISKVLLQGAGIKASGLRHFKIGVRGYKGGAVVKFRICEECLKNEYYKDLKCGFCDENPDQIVLFDTHPRGKGY